MADEREEAADLPRLEKLDSPAGSPPTASLSSLMELRNCVSNLSLAHEILMNPEFCFQPRSPAAHSLEGRVTLILHQAFWDRLREQLSGDPPVYDQAVLLLQELKTTLGSLLLPRHDRLRSELDQVLDLDLIQQQVHHGALDLHRLTRFVLGLMASLCAPVRDPEVRALQDLRDPLELLRGIFRVLGVMKSDMVNFSVQSLRPHLRQQAVHYHRTKFQQILERQPDFLDNTSVWLQAAAASQEVAAAGRRPLSATAVLHTAYMCLLRWDPQDQNYPETVLMDRTRLDALGRRLRTLVLEAAVLLLANTHGGAAMFSLQGFVGTLRQAVAALLEGSRSSEAALREALLAVGEAVLQRLAEARSAEGAEPPPPQENLDLLKGQISDLWKENHPVRTLIGERVQGFLQATLQGSSPELPPPLGLLGGEPAQLAAAFGRIVHFNRAVFGPFYAPILRKLLIPPGDGDTVEHSR